MRETSSDSAALNTPNIPNSAYAEPDHFFWYEQDKKKRSCRSWQSGVFKCCSIAVALLGVNALSFYVGYIVSRDNYDGSEYL